MLLWKPFERSCVRWLHRKTFTLQKPKMGNYLMEFHFFFSCEHTHVACAKKLISPMVWKCLLKKPHFPPSSPIKVFEREKPLCTLFNELLFNFNVRTMTARVRDSMCTAHTHIYGCCESGGCQALMLRSLQPFNELITAYIKWRCSSSYSFLFPLLYFIFCLPLPIRSFGGNRMLFQFS